MHAPSSILRYVYKDFLLYTIIQPDKRGRSMFNMLLLKEH